MEEIVRARLAEIEASENIRIVYACESGSRAWGFASTDSDYDVRFIYARPLSWYLSIDAKRDVIERPLSDALDISGWDLKKALLLFRKSNPPLYEWLGSPIIYLERGSTARKMRELAATYYSPTACLYHYLHMAQGNFRDYIRGDTIWIKKYFYILRPLLAMRWIEQGLGVIPTEFAVLVDRLVTDAELRQAIEELLEAKRAGAELDRGPKIAPISAFLASEIAHWETHRIIELEHIFPQDELDQLFRASLAEAWAS